MELAPIAEAQPVLCKDSPVAPLLASRYVLFMGVFLTIFVVRCRPALKASLQTIVTAVKFRLSLPTGDSMSGSGADSVSSLYLYISGLYLYISRLYLYNSSLEFESA